MRRLASCFAVPLICLFLILMPAGLMHSSVGDKSNFGCSADHQCRFWGMIGNNLPADVVQDDLINLQFSLKNLGAYNDDGWGLAFYNSSGNYIFRGKPSAYSDPNFDQAVQNITTSNAYISVGHVRQASSGATAIPNPHPFNRTKNGRVWMFGHNGGLDKTKLKNLIGQDYLDQNPPTVGANWSDSDVVDSDLYMLYVMKCIEQNGWNATLGISEAVADISAADYGAMNFFLTEGETLWGFRRGITLYYYYNSTAPYATIASQPPNSTQQGWTLLYDYNLIILTKDNPPIIIDNIITIPEHLRQLALPVLVTTTLLAAAISIKRKKIRNQANTEANIQSRYKLDPKPTERLLPKLRLKTYLDKQTF